MATRKEKEMLNRAAEDGHSEVELLLRDIAEEEGRTGIGPHPKVGEKVVIFTVTFFYRGVLLHEDYEYYVLAPGCEKVYETGALESFYKGNASHAEQIPRMTWIRKGAVVTVTGA